MTNRETAKDIADKFYDDILWRSTLMKPLYDSRDLAESLIFNALEKASKHDDS